MILGSPWCTTGPKMTPEIAQVTGYLKMKTAMNAVLAANRFKASLAKKDDKKEGAAD